MFRRTRVSSLSRGRRIQRRRQVQLVSYPFEEFNILLPQGFLQDASNVVRRMVEEAMAIVQTDSWAYHPLYMELMRLSAKVERYNQLQVNELRQFLFAKLQHWEKEASDNLILGNYYPDTPPSKYVEMLNGFLDPGESDEVNVHWYSTTVLAIKTAIHVLQAQPTIGPKEQLMFFELVNCLPYCTQSKLINMLWKQLYQISPFELREDPIQDDFEAGCRNYATLKDAVNTNKCLICKSAQRRSYNNLKLLKAHMKRMHPLYNFVCDECPAKKIFINNANLENHKAKFHLQPFLPDNLIDHSMSTRTQSIQAHQQNVNIERSTHSNSSVQPVVGEPVEHEDELMEFIFGNI